MNNFFTALYANAKNDALPSEYDFYGKLIGDWDILWVENEGTEKERKVKGEWLFARTLEGMAIQDLFIVPSRAERKINPQPDAEYGTTVRIYNPKTYNWDIYYGCAGQAVRLEARKEGNLLVQTEILQGKLKWIFSNIMEDSFKWERNVCNEDGTWKTKAVVYAKRTK